MTGARGGAAANGKTYAELELERQERWAERSEAASGSVRPPASTAVTASGLPLAEPATLSHDRLGAPAPGGAAIPGRADGARPTAGLLPAVAGGAASTAAEMMGLATVPAGVTGACTPLDYSTSFEDAQRVVRRMQQQHVAASRGLRRLPPPRPPPQAHLESAGQRAFAGAANAGTSSRRGPQGGHAGRADVMGVIGRVQETASDQAADLVKIRRAQEEEKAAMRDELERTRAALRRLEIQMRVQGHVVDRQGQMLGQLVEQLPPDVRAEVQAEAEALARMRGRTETPPVRTPLGPQNGLPRDQEQATKRHVKADTAAGCERSTCANGRGGSL